jgi:hypothetical protein
VELNSVGKRFGDKTIIHNFFIPSKKGIESGLLAKMAQENPFST